LSLSREDQSQQIAGQAVGVKEVEDGIWPVSFMDYDLGYIDLDEKTLQPHYRQTEKLLGCHANHLRQRTSQCGAVRQQSSRSLTSADPPTGTANAQIQICPAHPKVSLAP
jgi:hypothetical protein